MPSMRIVCSPHSKEFLSARPMLDRKVTVRHDRRSGRVLLLYPERGLELTRTADAIVRLCSGGRSVRQILDCLIERYGGEPREVIERDVCTFLQALMDRGLLHAQ